MVSRKELVDISGQGLCGGWKARNSRKRSRRSPEALTAGGPTLRGWHDLLTRLMQRFDEFAHGCAEFRVIFLNFAYVWPRLVGSSLEPEFGG